MLLKKKRSRSIRSLVGSPESKDWNDVEDSLFSEVKHPSKRIALHVRIHFKRNL